MYAVFASLALIPDTAGPDSAWLIAGGETAHVWHSVIDTSPESAFVERLAAVRNDVVEAIRRFAPNAACVESLFFRPT